MIIVLIISFILGFAAGLYAQVFYQHDQAAKQNFTNATLVRRANAIAHKAFRFCALTVCATAIIIITWCVVRGWL